MSKVKLTLTIEESVIAHAKAVARRNRQSLSEMIERFLAEQSPTGEGVQPVEISTALKLRGAARSALSNKSDREIRAMMYKDRYGV